MRVTQAIVPPTQTLEHVLGADPAVVRGYARAVDDALREGPLSLMDRDRLVRRGQRLGLKRFDANLVIAAMEQRRRSQPGLRMAVDLTEPSEPPRHRWATWLTAATVQGAIIAGLWVICFG